MDWKEFFSKNKKALLIIFFIWLIILVLFGFNKLNDAPVLCWDGLDEKTGQPFGGCEPRYSIAILGMILPFILWTLILIIIIVGLKKFRK